MSSSWQVVHWARAQHLSDAYVKERSERGGPPSLVRVSAASRRAVLRCLADHADAQGECWPSMRRMAGECGLSRSTVVRVVRTLRDDGLVERRRRPNRSSVYRLRFQHTEVP